MLPFAEGLWAIQTWAAPEQGQFHDLLPATPPPPDSLSSPEAAPWRRLQLLLFPDPGGESGLGARSTVQGFPWKMLEESSTFSLNITDLCRASGLQHAQSKGSACAFLLLAWLFKPSTGKSVAAALALGSQR